MAELFPLRRATSDNRQTGLSGLRLLGWPRRGMQTTAYMTSAVIGIVLWQIIAGLVPGVILAPPLKVARDLYAGLLVNHTLAVALFHSLHHMVLGLAISLATAVPLGFLMGRSRTVEELVQPLAALIYAIPPVAFVPFMIVWFGLGFEARVALVVMMSFFEILYVVSSGARGIPQQLFDVAHSFAASRVRTVLCVLLPACFPTLFTALRVGLVRAINAMITAELFFAAVNLGKIMKQAGASFDTARMLAVIALLCLFGLIAQEGLKWLEGRMLPWHIREAS